MLFYSWFRMEVLSPKLYILQTLYKNNIKNPKSKIKNFEFIVLKISIYL